LYCLNALAFQEDVVGEVVNIGPDEESCTINDLAEMCANETGLNLDVLYHKDRPQEVKIAVCSSDKARKLLGYKTSTNVRQSVQKTAEYIRTRGTKKFQYHLPLEIVNDKTPDTWKNKLI
jgi:UDP-glucose 4-epimerase